MSNCQYFKSIGSPFLFKRNKGHSNSPQEMEGSQSKQRDRPRKIKNPHLAEAGETRWVCGGGCALMNCEVPAATPAPLMFPELCGGRGTGDRSRQQRWGKAFPRGCGREEQTHCFGSALGVRFAFAVSELDSVYCLSSGCCVKPVFSAGIYPLAVESILHPIMVPMLLYEFPISFPLLHEGFVFPSWEPESSPVAARAGGHAWLQCLLPGISGCLTRITHPGQT